MSGYVGIPMSYTPVEYIESSGTQFIDTEVFAHNTEMSIQFQYTNLSAVTYVCGSSDGTNNRFGLVANRPSNNDICYGDKDNNYYTLGTANTSVHTVVYNNSSNQVVYDDVVKGTLPDLTAQSIKPFDLFALSGASGATSFSHVRIMYCKIKDKTTNQLIRDFIPVLDDKNVACLYDLVEGKFYYNQGAGTFAAGSATGQPVSIGDRARKIIKGYVGIPMSYTPVEYIESSGTQYIDTGFSAPNGFKAIGKIIVANGASVFGTVIGSHETASPYKNNFFRYNNTNKSWHVGELNSSNNIFTYGTVYEFECSTVKTGQYLKINGSTIVGPTSTSAAQSGYPLFIFARNANGAGQYGDFKLYYLKVYDNSNNLVRDYIPVLDSNNVACLLDKVSNSFYYNNGTGTFSYGTTGTPVVADVARKIKKGYVGVNGVAQLCFGALFPEMIASITDNANHSQIPALGNTTDYILVFGGAALGGSTPTKTVTAYNSNGVASSAPDLTTQSWHGTAGGFKDYAICSAGKSASSGSSRTNQCLAYDNNLTRQSLSTSEYVYEPSFASNETHFMISGGSNYSSHQSWICSYNTSFVKTTPSSMSITRRCNSTAPVGDYIVCCGGLPSYGNVDFYDNSNVRTTSSNPYGSKATYRPLALGTKNHAIIFGGSTSDNISNSYTDCKAYDKNKVLTSFSLPTPMSQQQGYSTGDYACVYYGSNEYIYDDNLVLVNTGSTGTYGYGMGKFAANTKTFAMEKANTATTINLFKI